MLLINHPENTEKEPLHKAQNNKIANAAPFH